MCLTAVAVMSRSAHVAFFIVDCVAKLIPRLATRDVLTSEAGHLLYCALSLDVNSPGTVDFVDLNPE